MLVWSCLERAHRRSQPKSVTPDLGLDQYDDGRHDKHIADSHFPMAMGGTHGFRDSIRGILYCHEVGWDPKKARCKA